MTKPGRKQKDAVIVDGFNTAKSGGMTQKDITAAVLRKVRKEQEVAEARIARAEAVKAEAEAQKEALAAQEEVSREEEALKDEKKGDADSKSAYKMLQDLRYGYRNSTSSDGSKGRTRLLKLMESDAEFKFVVKELVKIEGSLLAAKIRKEGGDGEKNMSQSVFVVLKGLESEKVLLESAGMSDLEFDPKQISAATNPDGSEL